MPVIRIPKAITENSNILLFNKNLSELSSEMILGFIIVNEYHKATKIKLLKLKKSILDKMPLK